MNDIQFTVRYNGKDYNFKYGSEVYIFHTAIYNDVKSINKILKIVDLVQACYLEDSDRTPLGALSDYVCENWVRVKDMSRNKLLDNFYNDDAA